MSSHSANTLKRVLVGLHATRTHRLFSRWTRGVGAILMLHQVCPPSGEEFEPSRILQVTPEFLDQVIRKVRSEGIDTISLDEVHSRLVHNRHDRPFVCFTLDDGYRDNLVHAMPVFEAHNVPFAIYLPDTFADGDGDLWWLALEAVIRKANRISFDRDGAATTLSTASLGEKLDAHTQIYWWLRSIDEFAARGIVRKLANEHDVDGKAIASELMMTWDEVRTVHANPLATIAAHTSDHLALAKLSEDRMHAQIDRNLQRLADELGERPFHLSYPYGCELSAGPREFDWARTLGLKTAVTTRKGMLFREHANHLTALPRLSLNGDFQDIRHLEVLLSGVPFALLNRGRRLNVT